MFLYLYAKARSNTRQDSIPQFTSQSISSNLFADNDLYDNDNYESDADLKIGKEPETDLKQIEFNIDVNNNEINDLNNKDAVHLKDGLADDTNIDIEDSGIQHNQDD